MASEFKALQLNGCVGLDSITEQVISKSVQKSFAFNILCVGDTGIGKSSLIETLFGHKFSFTPSSHEQPAVQLKCHTEELTEKNVKLLLTVIETCGFADQINKDGCAQPIIDYLEAQFEIYLKEELRINRNMFQLHDSRVHACLYFLAPTGHSLRSLDLVTMRFLHDKVNLIPIIAKADTLTPLEVTHFKERIRKELQENQINCYSPDGIDADGKIFPVPFAVVSASLEKVKLSNGRQCRGRQYPWGLVLTDDPTHCDFTRLREHLLREHMLDLREATHTRHYERFRQARLEQMGFADENFSLQEIFETRRTAQLQEQVHQEETMRQHLLGKVKSKEEQLKESERVINAEFESVKRKLAEEKKRLDDKKRQLEDEESVFLLRKQQRFLGKENGHNQNAFATLKRRK